jgi:hypothetical protein
VLPFLISKEQACSSIRQFVNKRQFFAHPQFKAEFSTETITGVYFPYFLMNATTHNDLQGKAGRVKRRYTVGTGKNTRTYYDIDMYDIGRNFNLSVEGLTLEARAERRNVSATLNTNNIINTILPFDTENVVAYNGNYLKGFTSERRDSNVDDVRELASSQLRDVARHQAQASIAAYDAGVKWEHEVLDLGTATWRTAYLPVWLYSYMETKRNGSKLLHYVAVNARTGETMGSVPVSTKRLLGISAIIEAVAIPLGIAVMLLLY